MTLASKLQNHLIRAIQIVESSPHYSISWVAKTVVRERVPVLRFGGGERSGSEEQRLAVALVVLLVLVLVVPGAGAHLISDTVILARLVRVVILFLTVSDLIAFR
jgi:hypothetical protein